MSGNPVQVQSSAVTDTLSTVLGNVGNALDRAADRLADGARVARFLSERSRFRPRPDDIFVASYPRSGTTWTQFILYLLAGNRFSDFRHLSAVSPWWERSFAYGTGERFAELPSPRIFKTHLPYRWLPSVGRFVYLQRDGRDVAVSYYHLYRSHLGYCGSFEQFFERFIAGRLQYGSWRRHVAGWEQQRENARVLLIRYEDLRGNTAAAIAAMANHLNIRATSSQIARVVEQSSFAVMKQHEDKFDHVGELVLQRGITEGRFLRKGTTREGDEMLTPAQREVFARWQRQPLSRPGVEWRLPAFLH